MDMLLQPQRRRKLCKLFSTFSITPGLWNPLEISLLGIWSLGIGSFLRRERSALGILTLVIGGFAMLDALDWITQIDLIFRIGVFEISLLIIWGACFGINILRRPVET